MGRSGGGFIYMTGAATVASCVCYIFMGKDGLSHHNYLLERVGRKMNKKGKNQSVATLGLCPSEGKGNTTVNGASSGFKQIHRQAGRKGVAILCLDQARGKVRVE
jgi:hypothetical protein